MMMEYFTFATQVFILFFHSFSGRMKPDVVAPGYRILAPRAYGKENNNSETYETMGTSFSAPVVSGNAALIRQYFEEGWFPCGSKGCSNQSMNPSGSLVKAIIMNGATQTLKNVQKVPSGQIMERVVEYDNNAGMGLINLMNSLPLSGVNDMDAFGINNRPINDGNFDYIIVKTKRCNNNEMDTLRVTLSWYDPPGARNCAHCLINDLDLVVEKTDNERNSVIKRYYPNGLSNGPDTKNNVERIRVTTMSGDEDMLLKIIVKARNLSTRNQKYSLIATGCFDVVEEKNGLQCSSN